MYQWIFCSVFDKIQYLFKVLYKQSFRVVLFIYFGGNLSKSEWVILVNSS